MEKAKKKQQKNKQRRRKSKKKKCPNVKWAKPTTCQDVRRPVLSDQVRVQARPCGELSRIDQKIYLGFFKC
jgi:hypothetical protein